MNSCDDKQIGENIAGITLRMCKAAEKAGRSPEDVALVAVTKTYPVECAIAAVGAGATLLGENKVQEAIGKQVEFANRHPAGKVEWHLIGHLQSNKALKAVSHFDLIHSVDSADLARVIQKHAAAVGKTQRVLLQVNISEEESKSGFDSQSVVPAIGEILEKCPNVMIEGLMTMAPISENLESVRPVFRALRLLRDRLTQEFSMDDHFQPKHLSMGMTQDFEMAIEEGATLIRVGTAIFGQRTYPTE